MHFASGINTAEKALIHLEVRHVGRVAYASSNTDLTLLFELTQLHSISHTDTHQDYITSELKCTFINTRHQNAASREANVIRGLKYFIRSCTCRLIRCINSLERCLALG